MASTMLTSLPAFSKMYAGLNVADPGLPWAEC